MRGFAGADDEVIEFRDIVLIESAETFVYRCVAVAEGDDEGEELYFETPEYPTGRELLDAALDAYHERD